jgi:hypothetical protein
VYSDNLIPGHACRRRSVREEVALAGSALALGCSRSIIISDLSADGAQIDARDLPPPGEDMLMVAGSQDAFAKIVWRTDDKCGIRFDESMPAENIALMKEEAAWTSVAGWWR